MIVDRLVESWDRMNPGALAGYPLNLFRALKGAPSIKARYDDERAFIEEDAHLDRWRPLMLAILDTCMWCAHATRAPESRAQRFISKAENQSGVALLLFALPAHEAHRRKEGARHAKKKQAEANGSLADHVLQQAARSELSSVSGAAGRIAQELVRVHGSLEVAMGHFGARLSVKGGAVESMDRITKRFTEYITKAMKKSGALAKGERVSASAFKLWKETFRLPG